MSEDVKRASLAEVLDFANKVRAAGGGNPLDALMPAVPQDSQQCLIAKNLNFNCQVYTLGTAAWVMKVDNAEIRDRIAESLGLDTRDVPKQVWRAGVPDVEIEHLVFLPEEIGQVAADFDDVLESDLTVSYDSTSPDANEDGDLWTIAPDANLDRLKEFWPLVEASAREAFGNAEFVNDKGEIVL